MAETVHDAALGAPGGEAVVVEGGLGGRHSKEHYRLEQARRKARVQKSLFNVKIALLAFLALDRRVDLAVVLFDQLKTLLGRGLEEEALFALCAVLGVGVHAAVLDRTRDRETRLFRKVEVPLALAAGELPVIPGAVRLLQLLRHRRAASASVFEEEPRPTQEAGAGLGVGGGHLAVLDYVFEAGAVGEAPEGVRRVADFAEGLSSQGLSAGKASVEASGQVTLERVSRIIRPKAAGFIYIFF